GRKVPRSARAPWQIRWVLRQVAVLAGELDDRLRTAAAQQLDGWMPAERRGRLKQPESSSYRRKGELA
ncbi:MAG TPA: hypothetical protein VE078_04535, partial [Thermoanaerobaculia bacterium]|nr:hypothetical protein [Thermoanaerobaculia bacterium]